MKKQERIKSGFLEKNWNNGRLKLVEFNPELLSWSIAKDEKHIQMIINGQDYFRVANLGHPGLLRHTLEGFGLDYDVTTNEHGEEIPLAVGDGYKLVGAGRIRNVGEVTMPYHRSKNYVMDTLGTNGAHLERMFGQENVSDVGFIDNYPSYLVRF